MSNGYLVAAAADLGAAHEIAEGFGLDVIDATSVRDAETTSAALADAANVGLLLSTDAARDEAFVALLRTLAARLQRAQLITVTGDARSAFDFLPAEWPAMSLDEARARSSELLRRRQAETPPAEDATRAEPLPPAAEAEPAPEPAAPEAPTIQEDKSVEEFAEQETETGSLSDVEPGAGDDTAVESADEDDTVDAGAGEDAAGELLGGAQGETPAPAGEGEEPAAEPAPESAPPAEQEAPVAAGPPPAETAPTPPPHVEAPQPPPQVLEPQAPPQPAPAPASRGDFGRAIDMHSTTEAKARSERLGETAPADATAFAPSKLRRGTPELVRIVVHQPKDLNAVIKAAKKIDPRTEPAPQGMPIGDIARGSNIGVALEVRGGSCDGALQRREWKGDPIDFNFAVEADANVKQVVMLARVFVDDAQIGVLAFTRKVSGPAKKPHGPGDRARLKRHKRVFLSYSSQDRETVSTIATAYQMAGVEHFWDRTSLKSGEEWNPRLRREIDRADLFHLCWSKAAAQSQWVQKEAEHALTRRRKNSGKPEITVQMLDGPPWAPHPPELDTINFDDFVRAAIVGYARGDGS